MREAPHRRDGREIQRVTRVLREGADAALAEDDLIVALGHDVLGSQQPFVERRRKAALQKYGQTRLTRAIQQREVLHVARADLNNVAVTFDKINARSRRSPRSRSSVQMPRALRREYFNPSSPSP